MLKRAYYLGVKLAQLEEENPDATPADLLADALQQLPDMNDAPEAPPKRNAIGLPDDDSSYWGSPSENFAFDGLGHLGVSEQGPSSTGI